MARPKKDDDQKKRFVGVRLLDSLVVRAEQAAQVASMSLSAYIHVALTSQLDEGVIVKQKLEEETFELPEDLQQWLHRQADKKSITLQDAMVKVLRLVKDHPEVRDVLRKAKGVSVKQKPLPENTDDPPSNDWGDYMPDDEYQALDDLNEGLETLVDPEQIARLRMSIAQREYAGKDASTEKRSLEKCMEVVSRIRAGAHRPAKGTPWTQDFSGLDVKDPPSRWGLMIDGHGMVDWLWYTKEEAFPEPKDAKEVKKKLDERKRLHFCKEDRKVADFKAKEVRIFKE